MKRKFHNVKLLLISLVTAFTFSCTSYLENPLIDKETGEDIDLLVIDSSVFPVRLKIFMIDSISKSAVLSPAIVSFSGKNHNDIITLSGKKQPEFHTSSGFIELAIDPNITVSETEPLIFTIHIKTGEHQEYSRECHFNTQGVKEIELLLSKIL